MTFLKKVGDFLGPGTKPVDNKHAETDREKLLDALEWSELDRPSELEERGEEAKKLSEDQG